MSVSQSVPFNTFVQDAPVSFDLNKTPLFGLSADAQTREPRTLMDFILIWVATSTIRLQSTPALAEIYIPLVVAAKRVVPSELISLIKAGGPSSLDQTSPSEVLKRAP